MKNRFDPLLVSPALSLVETISVIDSATYQIALVVDHNNKLIGTVTDGDVRRALLAGSSLSDPVSNIMNKNYRYIRDTDSATAAKKLMSQTLLHHIPVLDSHNHVVDLLLIDDLLRSSSLPNSVVIMAGGIGSRLRPYTESCPKPMLLINGKPMLETIIERCISNGFYQFYISVNYLKEQIIDYFQDGSKWGIEIKYLQEEYPLGTAGSLQMLPDNLENPFVVMNGDILTNLNLSSVVQYHMLNKGEATICVRDEVCQVPYGVVQSKGIELDEFQEKPTYTYNVNTGIYVVNPSLLRLLPSGTPCDMPSLLQMSKKAGGRILVCPIHENWLDVGRPETFKQAQETFLKR